MTKLNRHVLRQALDALPSPALIVDAQSRDRLIVYVNPALENWAGIPASELIGRSFDAVAAEPPVVGTAEPWLLRTRASAVVELFPAPLYEQPGRAAYWLLRAMPAALDTSQARPFEPAVTGAFTSTGTWTRLLRDERTDPATGMPSRSAFMEVLLRDWAIARRDERRLSVIVLSVDALESYQTLFGRHAADACLRKIGHSIASTLRRAADFCARVGHDRFAVLIAGADEPRVAELAEQITHRVRDLAIHHPRSHLARYVTVSHGVATAVPGRSGTDEPDLLERAEADFTRRMATSSQADCRNGPEAGLA